MEKEEAMQGVSDVMCVSRCCFAKSTWRWSAWRCIRISLKRGVSALFFVQLGSLSVCSGQMHLINGDQIASCFIIIIIIIIIASCKRSLLSNVCWIALCEEPSRASSRLLDPLWQVQSRADANRGESNRVLVRIV